MINLQQEQLGSHPTIFHSLLLRPEVAQHHMVPITPLNKPAKITPVKLDISLKVMNTPVIRHIIQKIVMAVITEQLMAADNKAESKVVMEGQETESKVNPAAKEAAVINLIVVAVRATVIMVTAAICPEVVVIVLAAAEVTPTTPANGLVQRRVIDSGAAVVVAATAKKILLGEATAGTMAAATAAAAVVVATTAKKILLGATAGTMAAATAEPSGIMDLPTSSNYRCLEGLLILPQAASTVVAPVRYNNVPKKRF
jgi:hypothetical protein